MTDNQKKLVTFIYKYQTDNGILPSLKEVVQGIGVSDNKSALGIIESLVKKGYLAQVGAKTSAVIPTYKAQKELNLHILKPYTVDSEPAKINQPRDLAQNDANVTLESGFIPTGSEIKADGTQSDNNQQLRNIIQAANFLLSRSTPEKAPLLEVFKNLPINKQTEWTFLSILMLIGSTFSFGQNHYGIIAAALMLLIVFFITK